MIAQAAIVAAVLAALIAIPVGAVAFRLTGPCSAIGTWVIAEVFRLGFAQVLAPGGGSGICLPAALVRDIAGGRVALTYWIALGIAAGVTGCVRAILRARTDPLPGTIRDDAKAAAALGARVQRARFAVHVGAAGATGLVGALAFLRRLRITPEAASSVTDRSVVVILVVVIGGIGAIEGPILGVLAFFVLRETFSDLGSRRVTMLGAISAGVMPLESRGLRGLLTRRRRLALIPVSRPLPKELA